MSQSVGTPRTFGSASSPRTSESGTDCRLVIGGGGVPGVVAFAGATQALLDCGYNPTAVGGVSAGAIVAAMIACGYPLRETVSEYAPQIDAPLTPHTLLTARPALYGAGPIRKLLRKLFPGPLGRVNIPTHLIAANITTGYQSCFASTVQRDMALADAVYASMALPGLLPPAEIGDHWFVDGGLMSNAPADDVFGDHDDIILITGSTARTLRHPTSPWSFFGAVIEAAIASNMEEDAGDTQRVSTIQVPLHGDLLTWRPSASWVKRNWHAGYESAVRWVWRKR